MQDDLKLYLAQHFSGAEGWGGERERPGPQDGRGMDNQRAWLREDEYEATSLRLNECISQHAYIEYRN